MSEVNAEGLRALVARLENPKSKQTRERLRAPTGVGMCCLGHACEVYRLMTGHGEWIFGNLEGATFLNSNSVLPVPVMEWFGFMSTNPSFQGIGAAERNDGDATYGDDATSVKRHNLREIAACIRAEYPEVFQEA